MADTVRDGATLFVTRLSLCSVKVAEMVSGFTLVQMMQGRVSA
jgi:hypothetical protein